MQDNIGKIPLHMLCLAPFFVDSTRGAIEAYLDVYSEGKKADFMTDDEGRKPLRTKTFF